MDHGVGFQVLSALRLELFLEDGNLLAWEKWGAQQCVHACAIPIKKCKTDVFNYLIDVF